MPRPIRVYVLAALGASGDRLVLPSKTGAPPASKRIPLAAIAGAVAVAGLIYLAVTLKPWAINPRFPAPGALHPFIDRGATARQLLGDASRIISLTG